MKTTKHKISTIAIGRKGEKLAQQLLAKNGWRIIEQGDTRTPWDLRAEKDGDVLAINVKFGKKSNQVGVLNVKRLLYGCLKGDIPVFLFLIGKGYVLFSLEESTKISLNLIQGVIAFR